MPTSGVTPTQWIEYHKGNWRPRDGAVIGEALITIYVNGVELVTIMGTPQDQDFLTLGFLKNEGIITTIADVEVLRVSKAGCCVDVWLAYPFVRPQRKIITSGCGGGVTFSEPMEGVSPIHSGIAIAPEMLHRIMRKLHPPDSLYAQARGVHAAGLLDPLTEELLARVEDVGRHNAIDKLTGICLMENIETRDRVLLVTGRVSSEMLRKAAVMGCPLVASRTSPTSLSVGMALTWNITLVGYMRQGTMRIYSHPERLGYNSGEKQES
jgi:FdhD protein